MIPYLSEEWNETVLVNIGGKSDKTWVPMIINHGVYTDTDIFIILFAVICIVIMIYISFCRK